MSLTPLSLRTHDVPEEILWEILKEVKRNSDRSSLVACLLCCQRWRAVALPLLYRDIVLGNRNLETFATQFPRINSHLVRSMTIALDPKELGYGDQRDSPELRRILSQLRDTTAAISSMSKLSSFSVTVSGPPAGRGLRLPGPAIDSMLESLPETCVNLEIDSKGHDCCEPGSVHLCQTLRRILPRLRHFRVRLYTVCPAIFGSGFTVEDMMNDASHFKPVATPYLRTMVINCVCGRRLSSRLCLPPGEKEMRSDSTKARHALVKCLRLFLGSSGGEAIDRVWLLDMQRYRVQSNYVAYNRRDVIQNRTWTIPFRWISGSADDSSLMGITERKEALSYIWAIEPLAEAETWKETLGGSRLPAALLAEDSQGNYHLEKRPPIESIQSYRAQDPERMCTLWYGEYRTGVRLLDAVERDGLTDI